MARVKLLSLFAGFLSIDLIPRLKRIKYEKLYLPDQSMLDKFPNLKGIIQRPIRWNLVEEQYTAMIKHMVAIAAQTGPVDSILRRFNSFNRANPVYKGFMESGKALKTIHI